MKAYIRSDSFFSMRLIAGDAAAIDSIFIQSLKIAQGDVQEALLTAAFGVMDHRRFGIKIPFVQPLYLPLTFESAEEFAVRRKHLPHRVLMDFREISTNDADKLQHFFGSAYLAYRGKSAAITGWLGRIMEWVEGRFIVDGREDERDQFANRLGALFGDLLEEGYRILPSDVLWGLEPR